MFGLFTEAKKVAKKTSAENFAILEINKYFHMKITDTEKIAKLFAPKVLNTFRYSFENGDFTKYDVTLYFFMEFANDIDGHYRSVEHYGQAIAYTQGNRVWNLRRERSVLPVRGRWILKWGLCSRSPHHHADFFIRLRRRSRSARQ